MPVPFTLPPELRAHLERHPAEHGTERGVGRQFHAGVTVWRIDGADGTAFGYVWWIPASDDRRVREFTLAVFEPFRARGIARAALAALEAQAATVGVSALRAQVNTNAPATGLRMRRWLARRGYRVQDRRPGTDGAAGSDEEYLARAAWPVHLQKAIAAPGRGTRRAMPLPGTRREVVRVRLKPACFGGVSCDKKGPKIAP